MRAISLNVPSSSISRIKPSSLSERSYHESVMLLSLDDFSLKHIGFLTNVGMVVAEMLFI